MEEKHHHHHELTTENEKRTLVVILLTVLTMFAEILYGYYTNSMALLADGYHMGTHALALGLTFVAYVLVRKLSHSEHFINGPKKIEVLAGYTSSLFLGFTGIWIIFEAIGRFINPLEIKFDEAILVAIIGLIVNTVCILIMELKNKSQGDYNYKAAYYHILADALTSILAILALIAGKFFNIMYLDPIIGILGGILILRWAIGLIRDTVKILVDYK